MTEAKGCSDHPCDGCARCTRGQCCRRDRPLPPLGDWEGPIYGELGVLAADEDGQQVQCHVCGASFRSVGVHAVQAHQLSAREYKAIFGLRLGTALVAPESRARLQARPIDHLRPYWEQAAENLRSLTPERRNSERHWALEARRDPANRARWQALSQRYAPEAQKRVQTLRQDPQWAAEWRRRYRQGRGQLGRTPRPCIVCGTAFPSQTGRRTCSDVCEAAARSRTARGREVSSEMRERLRVAREAQRRADPAWQERTVLLRQLPPDLFDALPEAQRLAVRGFYGLDTNDAQPLPTLEALAPRCGVGHARTVRALVRRATASLLGLALADPARRAVAQCSVCDQPILRPQASHTHACGPACMAELRRHARARQYLRELEAREPRRRALLELPPETIASLQGRDRTILQLYYGLEGQEPRSQYAVAVQLGLRKYLVSYLVRTVTARLLGWRVLDPTGQLQVPCTICGTSLDRARPQANKQHTCSPACQAELSRRQASAMQACRQATAVESLRGQLEALPATAFNILSERDQSILRAFCGMDRMEATTPGRTEVLATEFGLTKMSISRIVRRAASRLLGDARQARSLARPTGPAIGDKRQTSNAR